MFVKGHSGNPTGRPKRDKSKIVLVREAWEQLTSKKPWLVAEALERGLTGGRPLGFLELGARVMKEIGQSEEKQSNITIVVNSTLNTRALRPATVELIPIPAPQAHPMLPETTDADITLLEDVE